MAPAARPASRCGHRRATAIVAVGDDVGRGRREIDADGLLVTPGFVDPHTHYDGQATWDPSSPRPPPRGDDRGDGQLRCRLRAGRGRPPRLADRHDGGGRGHPRHRPRTKGCSWDWRSFPEYLDASTGSRGPSTSAPTCHTPPCARSSWASGAPTRPSTRRRRARLHGQAPARASRPARSACRPRGPSTSHEGRRQPRHAASPGAGADDAGAALRDHGTGVFQLLSDSYRTTDDEFAAGEFAPDRRVRPGRVDARSATPCSRTSRRPSAGAT